MGTLKEHLVLSTGNLNDTGRGSSCEGVWARIAKIQSPFKSSDLKGHRLQSQADLCMTCPDSHSQGRCTRAAQTSPNFRFLRYRRRDSTLPSQALWETGVLQSQALCPTGEYLLPYICLYFLGSRFCLRSSEITFSFQTGPMAPGLSSCPNREGQPNWT